MVMIDIENKGSIVAVRVVYTEMYNVSVLWDRCGYGRAVVQNIVSENSLAQPSRGSTDVI